MQSRALSSRTRARAAAAHGGGATGGSSILRSTSAARPRATTAAANAAASATAPPQASLRHRLPDGAELEVVFQPAATSNANINNNTPPVLLVHGSYHAAWCWRDTFMPRLAARGFPSYAVSLRAQGASARSPLAPGTARGVAGTLRTHADDLASVIGAVARGVGEGGDAASAAASPRPPPVVVSHSFSGLILQDLISRGGGSGGSNSGNGSNGDGSSSPTTAAAPALSGTAFLASVPPSGNKEMVVRFLKRDPWASAKLTYAFIAASFAKDAQACRECFLSRDAPAELVESVRARIEANLSPLRLLDLADMNRRVPLPPPPPHAASFPRAPSLVLRGADDTCVDGEAAAELEAWLSSGAGGAAAAAASPPCTRVEIQNLAHDVMLDVRWEAAAEELLRWLEGLPAAAA